MILFELLLELLLCFVFPAEPVPDSGRDNTNLVVGLFVLVAAVLVAVVIAVA